MALGLVPRTAVALPFLFLAGGGSVLWNVVAATYLQRVVPGPILGRTSSASRMIGFIGTPVGAATAGLLAHGLGTPHTYAVMGAMLLLAALWAGRTFTPVTEPSRATA